MEPNKNNASENFSSQMNQHSPSNGQEKKKFTREFNYKSSRSGNAKTIPAFLSPLRESSCASTVDSDNFRFEQNLKKMQELNNSGKENSNNSPKERPAPIDVRKDKNFPEKVKIQVAAATPKVEKPLLPPPHPTVSFAQQSTHSKEAFRPPTPIPFMHRVNSLPYVGPLDNDPFDLPQENFYGLQEENSTSCFVEESFFDPSINNRPFTPLDSRALTPIDNNCINPMLLPPPPPDVDSIVHLSSSGSSRQLSPSFRERSPSPTILFQQKKPKKKHNYLITILLVLLLAIVLNIL